MVRFENINSRTKSFHTRPQYLYMLRDVGWCVKLAKQVQHIVAAIVKYVTS